MGDSPDSWTVFFNTADASPGEYQLAFLTESGACTAQIVVN